MKVVAQRVDWGRVVVAQNTVGEIGFGLVLLTGIAPEDDEKVVAAMAKKVAHLRIFEDSDSKTNLSLLEAQGAALVVPQFTLFADCTKGRRPFFGNAGAPEHAEKLCGVFAEELLGLGIATHQGQFGATMHVELCNSGPMTICLDSREFYRG